ncbi:unnamed protein product [Sphagnum balticum]
MGRSVAAAAAVCMMGLFVFLAMATEVHSVCPSMYEYMPCLPAAQNPNVMPTSDCCKVIAQEGRQRDGPYCLCQMAHAQVLRTQFGAAVQLVGKCKLPNPTGYVCRNRLRVS